MRARGGLGPCAVRSAPLARGPHAREGALVLLILISHRSQPQRATHRSPEPPTHGNVTGGRRPPVAPCCSLATPCRYTPYRRQRAVRGEASRRPLIPPCDPTLPFPIGRISKVCLEPLPRPSLSTNYTILTSSALLPSLPYGADPHTSSLSYVQHHASLPPVPRDSSKYLRASIRGRLRPRLQSGGRRAKRHLPLFPHRRRESALPATVQPPPARQAHAPRRVARRRAEHHG